MSTSSAPDPSAGRGTAVAALVLVQILFAVHYGIAQDIVAEIPTLAWALLRSAGAAVLLTAAVAVSRRPWPRSVRTWGLLAGLGFFGVTLNQILFIEGISRSTTVHGVLVMATIPLQTLLLSALARHEALTVRKLTSVLVGAGGIVILLRLDELIGGEAQHWMARADGSAATRFGDTVLAGDLLMLVNALSFSLFLVLAKRPVERLDPLVLTAGIFLTGSVGVALVGLPALLQLSPSAVAPATWGLAAFVIVGPTVGTYVLNLFAMRRVPASIVGLFIYLQFLFTAVLGVTWRAETVDLRLGLAATAVLGGIGLRLWRPRRPPPRG